MMQLPPGLSFCEVQNRFVFLDIGKDRYFCLGGPIEAAWRSALAGAAGPAELEALERRGLLVQGPAARLAPCPSQIAEASLLDGPAPAPASPLRMMILGWDLMHTRRRLRANLSESLDRLGHARRTVDAKPTTLAGSPVDHDGLRAIAADFARLGLVTREHNQCLPRSLALAVHLARRRFSPELVIAVRLGPFRAHCWVECGGMLVNDRFERVRPYTPIRRL